MREYSFLGYSQQLYHTRFEGLHGSFGAAVLLLFATRPRIIPVLTGVHLKDWFRERPRYHTGFAGKSAALMLGMRHQVQ